MRLATVRRRLRLACLTEAAIQFIHSEMLGVKDEESLTSGKHNNIWVEALKSASSKFPKVETHLFIVTAKNAEVFTYVRAETEAEAILQARKSGKWRVIPDKQPGGTACDCESFAAMRSRKG